MSECIHEHWDHDIEPVARCIECCYTENMICIDKMQERIGALEAEIEEWKKASGLADAHGDPVKGIDP